MPILNYPDDAEQLMATGPLDLRPSDDAEPDPSVGQVLGAAFRQDNTIGSAVANKLSGIDLSEKDGLTGEEVWKDIQGTPYEAEWSRFAQVFNRKGLAAMKAQIDMEREDNRTLEAGGWLGAGFRLGAAIADVPSLIPGGEVVRGLSTGAAVARTAIRGGIAGALAGGASEFGLQASQETRPGTQSLVTIGAGALLGTLLGGGAGALLSRAERNSLLHTTDHALNAPDTSDDALAEIHAGISEGQSAGAAAVPVEDLANYDIQGKSARAVGKATAKLNPVLRAAQSPSAVHRSVMADIQETGFYLTKNAEGEGNIAAESAAKYWERGALGSGLTSMQQIFNDARKAGYDKTAQEFREAISYAMRRSDEGDHPAVTAAANKWRSVLFDPLKDEAIETGRLAPDVNVKTAASYLSRLWNRNKLEAGEGRFKSIVRPWLDDQLRDLEMKADEIRIGNSVVESDKVREQHVQASERFERIEARLAERQGVRGRKAAALEGMRKQRGNVLKERAPADVVKALRGADENRAMVEVVRDARKGERSAAKKRPFHERSPVLALIRSKGGVRIGSKLDAELRAMDVSPKTHPGLFRKEGGIGDVDNFVKDQEPFFADLPDDGSTYVDPRAIMNAIREELAGRPLQTPDQAAAEEAIAGLSDAAERWLESVGLDPNATVKAVRDFIKGVTGAERNLEGLDSRISRFEREMEDFDKATDKLLNEREISRSEAQTIEEQVNKLDEQLSDVQEIANSSPRVGLIVDYAKTKRDLFKKRLSERNLTKRVDAIRRLENEGKANPEMLAELTAKEADLAALDGEIKGLVTKAGKLQPMVPKIRQEIPDFVSVADRQDYLNQIANDIFNQLTGRARLGAPTYDLTMTARGPLKERTFNIPDHLIEDFLENDIELIARRYARIMSADVELARMSRRRGFSGNPDLKDMIEAVQADYQKLREKVRASEGKQAAKDKTLKSLNNRERADIEDIAGVRDILRGQYKLDAQHSNFARITNAAMTFNYLRAMGGVLAASMSDAGRLPMVHGLDRYMGEGIAPLLTNLKAVKLSVADAKLLGVVTERVLLSRIATMAELADPYAMNSPFERFLRNAADIFTRMTLLPWWNDMHKSIASVLIQNRILKNSLANFEKLPAKEKNYMGFLGINADVAKRIRSMFDQNGQIDGNVHIANIERWSDKEALRAYAAAVNKDADSIIVTKGAGDTPLFMHTPVGRALGQFKSFSIASNQRVLMRGLQEGPGSILTGLIGMTGLGMLTYWAKQTEAGRELSDNFGTWLAEGIDRAGFLAVAFEINNVWEKLGGPGFYTVAAKAFPNASQRQPASRYAVRSVAGALAGPTFGLATDVASVLSLGAQEVGQHTVGSPKEVKFTPGDVGTVRRLTPFGSLPYWRWFIDRTLVPSAKEAVGH